MAGDAGEVSGRHRHGAGRVMADTPCRGIGFVIAQFSTVWFFYPDEPQACDYFLAGFRSAFANAAFCRKTSGCFAAGFWQRVMDTTTLQPSLA